MMIKLAKNAESKAKAAAKESRRKRSNQSSSKMGVYCLRRLAHLPNLSQYFSILRRSQRNEQLFIVHYRLDDAGICRDVPYLQTWSRDGESSSTFAT